MSLLRKFKYIQKSSKYTVFGWIRRQEKEFKLHNVHQLIASICVVFYDEDEVFNLMGASIHVSEDEKCITKKSDREGEATYLAFGLTTIPSTQSNCIYTWDLRINKLNFPTNITIGFNTSSSLVPVEQRQGMYYSLSSLGVYTDFRMTQRLGARGYRTRKEYRYCEKDVVRLILDMSSRKLSVRINEGPILLLTDNFAQKNKEDEYRLFVIMQQPGESVEIIKYTKRYFK